MAQLLAGVAAQPQRIIYSDITNITDKHSWMGMLTTTSFIFLEEFHKI